MNSPFSPSDVALSPATRPSHTSRLKQHLLACLNLVPQAAASVADTRASRSRKPDTSPPRWVELNKALDQLDKSISGLRQGDWEKLGVVIPILAQLSLQLSDLLHPSDFSTRYQHLRSKDYTRGLSREQAKALIALLRASYVWKQRAVDEASARSPSVLFHHPLDASLQRLLLDAGPSPSAPSSSPLALTRKIHLPVPLSRPLDWILLPPRALEKRLLAFAPWIPSTVDGPPIASTLLSTFTHLVIGSLPVPKPGPPPSSAATRRPSPHRSTRPKTQFRRAASVSSSSSSASSSDEESSLSSSSTVSSPSLSTSPFGPSLQTYTLHLLATLLPSLPSLVSIHIPAPLDTYPIAILELRGLKELTFASNPRPTGPGAGGGAVLRTTAPRQGGTGVRTLVGICVAKMLEMDGGVRVGDLVGWEDSEDEGGGEAREAFGEDVGEHLRSRFWGQ